MNLHALVRGAINAVNPDSLGVIRRNAGTYSTAPDGTQVPDYLPDVPDVVMQVQPLSGRDLKQAEALNLTTLDLAVYVNGEVTGVDRTTARGGDLIYVHGAWWLVTAVLEAWSPTAGWTKAGVTKQVGGDPP